ncbi:hypothetical protein AGABI2DRAFT_193648 [Agaricus bisporus var. bisporus H97]|uniref:hypothetical protein n=1 Tax=Agaricus bisporus var. bisporus (strain H97 / ATCC MYA-4626 / FGSC 10389) TaxID=936046 RepID=UPI00029F6913|nr:hypothetical protein AGABI2DRAFT_193648 [Agaricus bisporus var. bisporus H97]EKV45703.1 hypothetical protein AGABI2DRAFT_193648 [Agaricus bisporus var. bisporus H97]
MGGNAFGSVLSPTSFPRLPPAVYNMLKARLLPILEELYVHVGVPSEAPEKENYGDLDIVVCLPRQQATPAQNPSNSPETREDEDIPAVNVPHELVISRLRAQYSNPMDGNRTSNFAIAIPSGEWAQCGPLEGEEETKAREEAGSSSIFYQVDVNVCASKDEWERTIFFNSFGDLGMIIGLLVNNAGLHFSNKGLKYPDNPNPPIVLSESFEEIFYFFGWSMEEWKQGFDTQLACYEWAIKNKFFDSSHFRPGAKKRKPGRTMYFGFIEWAGNLSQSPNYTRASGDIPDAKEASLDFFNKRAVYEERREEQRHREFLKNVFSGHRVRDWANLGNNWFGVKKIMDAVRERFGGEHNVRKFALEEGEESLRKVVLEVQAELGIESPSESIKIGEEEGNIIV